MKNHDFLLTDDFLLFFFPAAFEHLQNLLDICPDWHFAKTIIYFTETSSATPFLKTKKFGVSAEPYHENNKYVNRAILLDGKTANLV